MASEPCATPTYSGRPASYAELCFERARDLPMSHHSSETVVHLLMLPTQLCRGLATDASVRSEKHLEGLLPPRRVGLQLEVDRAAVAIERCTTPLQKYEVGLDAS